MKTPPRAGAPGQRRHSAFSIVELLLAMSVLTLLMVFLVQMLNAVSRTWADGERRVENYQNGRAILDLIARELGPAVISRVDRPQVGLTLPTLGSHQLIQNPMSPAQQSTVVPSMAPNSDSLFWQAPVATGVETELAEVGYYLTRDTTAGAIGAYQLKRFFVPSGNAKFLIYTRTPTGDYTPTATEAPWIASSSASLPPAFSASEFEAASSVVSDGIVGFWVRCFDVNGEPIPWFGTHSTQKGSASHLKFNSAARFQPAVPGTSGMSNAQPWPYTSHTAPAATASAHRLPSSIELSIVTVDARSLQRRPTIPALPVIAGPTDVPAAIDTYLNSLVNNRVESARLFTTRVRLDNGTQ